MIYVRRAAPADHAAIEACIASARVAPTSRPLQTTATRDVFVAERDAAVVGVLVMRRGVETIAIETLAMHAAQPPDVGWRDAGAAILFRHARAWAARHGFATIALDLEVSDVDRICRDVPGATWSVGSIADGSRHCTLRSTADAADR